MSKALLVDFIAEQTGLTKNQAHAAVDAMIDHIVYQIQNDEEVSLPGLGKFRKQHKAARKGRNPQTGQTITLPAKDSIKFKPSSVVDTALNG